MMVACCSVLSPAVVLFFRRSRRRATVRSGRWSSRGSRRSTGGALSEDITPEHLERVFFTAGLMIGFGAMRAANGGVNGRFNVVELVWE